jgi:VIT1/CCC1 family predicted Fe2+/Mn2+ transporter
LNSFPSLQLKELKDNHSRGQQQQTNVQDRYQELLGSRSNFVFHAVIAVLSFLIFGSVPLVIYGVLINKNYYDEVKLSIVAATSIACIILLTIGKVYTARPPKSYIKTVLYYVIMAVAASGISYIAGKLIKDLLDKFSHSESGFAITMPISDTSMETAWMSY